MNQKGFAPILIVLVVVFLCIGIAGGSYLVSRTYPNLISRAETPVTDESPNLSPSPVSTGTPVSSAIPVSKLKHKIVFLNSDMFYIADENGKNRKSFNEYFNLSYRLYDLHAISPDNKKILFSGIKVSRDELEKNIEQENAGDQVDTLVFDSETEKVEIISDLPVEEIAGRNSFVTPVNWSKNGREIVFNGGILSRTNVQKETSFNLYAYDLDNKKAAKLVEEPAVIVRTYYDPDSNFLVYDRFDPESYESGIITVDLISGNRRVFPLGGIINYYNANTDFGDYYVSGDRSKLTVFPVNENSPIARITLTDPDKSFNPLVVWSPDLSSFYTIVSDKNPLPDGGGKEVFKLQLYSRSGKLVKEFSSEADLQFNGNTTRLIGKRGIFSVNMESLLIYRRNTSEPVPDWDWQILDLKSGEVIFEQLGGGLGEPLFWY